MVPVAGVWPAFPVPDDIHDSFHGLLVPGTMRDSLFLLQAVLEQQFHLKPREIMTDTAALGAALARLRPQVVINAAAYTAVDRAETEAAAAARGPPGDRSRSVS